MKRLFTVICLSILLLAACGKKEEPKEELVEREAVLFYEEEGEEGKAEGPEPLALSDEAKWEFYDFYDGIKEAGERIEPPMSENAVDFNYPLVIRTTDMEKTLSVTRPEEGKVYVSKGLVNETLYYQVEEDGSWYQDLMDFVEENKN